MALYEITFLTKEETDPGVRAVLEANQASVTDESSLGRRRLAYPINKETQAVYTTYVFDCQITALPEIKRRLDLNTQILRYLLTVKRVVQPDKEMSKTVREAIEAAEKLEDTVAETPAPAAPVELPVETVETTEATPEAAEEPAETPVAPEAPVKKPRAKKLEKPVEDASTATEVDRLKALEDKLGEILKD